MKINLKNSIKCFFITRDVSNCINNSKQLLVADMKLILIINLKAFIFKSDNVFLLKCMCILFELQVIAHDVKTGFL